MKLDLEDDHRLHTHVRYAIQEMVDKLALNIKDFPGCPSEDKIEVIADLSALLTQFKCC